MNKRQLKKISKQAAQSLLALDHKDFYFDGFEYVIDFDGIRWDMECTINTRCALSILWDWFIDSITIQNPDEEDDELPEIISYPKGFNSLSEVNQIHFMIDLLGAIND